MIITKLNGGLGNQLFQYSAGKRLASVLDTELKLDISELGNTAYRTCRFYELAVFNISDDFAKESDLHPFRLKNRGRWCRLVRRSIRFPEGYVKEAHFHFDPKVLSLKGDVYLDGYWQSERYFLDKESVIRDILIFNQKPVTNNQELLQRMVQCNAVSVHVRRGDYLKDHAVFQIHGTCSIDYYFRAAGLIASKVEHPVFFVFSDEPRWVRENLHLPYPMTIVDHNSVNNGYEDLRLMSSCRHHIIANSTFSWWGAWLNPRENKIVIAPKRWFNNFQADTRDLFPSSWVVI